MVNSFVDYEWLILYLIVSFSVIISLVTTFVIARKTTEIAFAVQIGLGIGAVCLGILVLMALVPSIVLILVGLVILFYLAAYLGKKSA